MYSGMYGGMIMVWLVLVCQDDDNRYEKQFCMHEDARPCFWGTSQNLNFFSTGFQIGWILNPWFNSFRYIVKQIWHWRAEMENV